MVRVSGNITIDKSIVQHKCSLADLWIFMVFCCLHVVSWRGGVDCFLAGEAFGDCSDSYVAMGCGDINLLFHKVSSTNLSNFWVMEMARYVCLAHEKPRVFRDSRGVYYHIVVDHRDAFLKLPYDYYQSPKNVDFGKIVCRCGQTGFRNLRDLIVHLGECQNISIVYQKGLSKKVTYVDGMPREAADLFLKHRVSIREAAQMLYLLDDVVECAEKIAEDFCEKSKISRTTYIDGASLYIAAFLKNIKVSQLDIAHAFNISEQSVRKWYKNIIKTLRLELQY